MGRSLPLEKGEADPRKEDALSSASKQKCRLFDPRLDPQKLGAQVGRVEARTSANSFEIFAALKQEFLGFALAPYVVRPPILDGLH